MINGFWTNKPTKPNGLPMGSVYCLLSANHKSALTGVTPILPIQKQKSM
jgi:hypothetical protein